MKDDRHIKNVLATRQNNSIIGNKVKILINSQKSPSKKLQSVLNKLRLKQALTSADIKYLVKASARKKFS